MGQIKLPATKATLMDRHGPRLLPPRMDAAAKAWLWVVDFPLVCVHDFDDVVLTGTSRFKALMRRRRLIRVEVTDDPCRRFFS